MIRLVRYLFREYELATVKEIAIALYIDPIEARTTLLQIVGATELDKRVKEFDRRTVPDPVYVRIMRRRAEGLKVSMAI